VFDVPYLSDSPYIHSMSSGLETKLKILSTGSLHESGLRIYNSLNPRRKIIEFTSLAA